MQQPPHPLRAPSHISWNTQSPEKRPLRRYRQAAGAEASQQRTTWGHPDVYPQSSNQEEDKMTVPIERLKDGFLLPVQPEEYESYMKKTPSRPDRLHEIIPRTLDFVSQIMQRKEQWNLIPLDKKRLKEGVLQLLQQAPTATRERENRKFFEELVRGKSLQRLVKQLQARDKNKKPSLFFPFFGAKRREECMEYIYAHKVPLHKALWFFKLSQLAHTIFHGGGGGGGATSSGTQGGKAQQQQQLQKYHHRGWEQHSTELTRMFIKHLKEMLRKLEGGTQPVETNQLYQRWPYFAALYKHAFEEGILDRPEFLSELLDLLLFTSSFPFDRPVLFKLLITLASQFIDVFTQSAFLSRRLAFVICSRLRSYKRDYERRRSLMEEADPMEVFASLAQCQHHRTVILTMLGLLHTIVVDCPAACVWNPLEPSHGFPAALCGSPLDLLPPLLTPSVLWQHLSGEAAVDVGELLESRLAEVKRRSSNVEGRWAMSPASKSGFESLVDVCLSVVSALDMAQLNSPKALLKLYKCIFCPEMDGAAVGVGADAEEKAQKEMPIRIRTLLHWAITTEREGSHRAMIVCQLLQLRRRHCGEEVQEQLMEYLAAEGPSPTSSSGEEGASMNSFPTEFANLMLLLCEMQRHALFSHNTYVRALMRNGRFGQQEPVLARFRHLLPPSTAADKAQQQPPPASNEPPAQPTNAPENTTATTPTTGTNPAIISFIPTTTNSSLPLIPSKSKEGFPFQSSTTTSTSSYSRSSAFNAATSSSSSSPKPTTNTTTTNDVSSPLPPEDDHGALLPPEYPLDAHILLTSPELSLDDRLLIHTPIEQCPELRDSCNQRAILLYGIGDERDAAKQELKRIAKEVCRIWQKRLHVEFFYDSPEVRFRRRATEDTIAEAMARFNALTYYDQWVVCGWCVDSFLEMINEFLHCQSLCLPTSESLDLLCGMLATCQNTRGIVTLTCELLPLLIQLERLLASFRTDCVPGFVGCQLAYVLVGYLSEHFFYFLYSPEASTIVNGLYRLIEKELCAVGFPISGWARTISAFVLHAKTELMAARLNDQHLLGTMETFKRLFPESGASLMSDDLRHNAQLLMDLLKEPRRFIPYADLRLRLPSIEGAHTRYSFVVNAFVVARAMGSVTNDYCSLAELATLCSHITAQKPTMAGEWCVAVQELSYSSITKNGYSHLIQDINVDDLSTHYALSTFTILLASKYCFSAHALITRLLTNVFLPLIRSSDPSLIDGSEYGLCLALRIVTGLVCATDEPFMLPAAELSASNNASSPSTIQPPKIRRLISTTAAGSSRKVCADLRALCVLHLRELDVCIFPLLSAIAILMDQVKRRSSAKNGNAYRLNYLLSVLKSSLLAMCEEEWVVARMFRLVEGRPDLDMFNSQRLRHNNSIGQQLLRIALRRRSERRIKGQLMVCNGNSKKSLLDKLLSTMTLWNLRSTFYDIKLMIKEASPDVSQKHIHQQAIAADLLVCEIGKCCRDLFLNCPADAPTTSMIPPLSPSYFRFAHINFYWLISQLIGVCPRPDNIPQSFTGPVSVKAKLLKEVAILLDNGPTSAWLLSQQPFVNLLLTCTQAEELDGLMSSLLKYVQAIVGRAKESPTYPFMSAFAGEREGLLLRLNLVGGIFDALVSSANVAEQWAVVLFQLIFYEVVTPDRDGEYFDVCFDMLSTLVHGMMSSPVGSSTSAPSNNNDGEAAAIIIGGGAGGGRSSPRLPAAYNSWVKKIRKELGDRPIASDLHCLAQLLPLQRSPAELNVWDNFASTSSTITSTNTGNIPTASGTGAAASTSSTATGKLVLSSGSASSPLGGKGSSAAAAAAAASSSNQVQQQQLQQQQSLISLVNISGHSRGVLPQGIRLDKQPQLPQKQLMRLLHHTHYLDLPHAGMVGEDIATSRRRDIFLASPAMEPVAVGSGSGGEGQAGASANRGAPPPNQRPQQQQQPQQQQKIPPPTAPSSFIPPPPSVSATTTPSSTAPPPSHPPMGMRPSYDGGVMQMAPHPHQGFSVIQSSSFVGDQQMGRSTPSTTTSGSTRGGRRKGAAMAAGAGGGVPSSASSTSQALQPPPPSAGQRGPKRKKEQQQMGATGGKGIPLHDPTMMEQQQQQHMIGFPGPGPPPGQSTIASQQQQGGGNTSGIPNHFIQQQHQQQEQYWHQQRQAAAFQAQQAQAQAQAQARAHAQARQQQQQQQMMASMGQGQGQGQGPSNQQLPPPSHPQQQQMPPAKEDSKITLQHKLLQKMAASAQQQQPQQQFHHQQPHPGHQ